MENSMRKILATIALLAFPCATSAQTVPTQIAPIVKAIQAQIAAIQAAEASEVAALNAQITALNAIVVPVTPPPLTVSAPGTKLTTTTGQIVDKQLNVWTVGPAVAAGGFEVMENGVWENAGTASLIEIDFSGVVWIQNPNTGTWYSNAGTYWATQAAGPVVTGSLMAPPAGYTAAQLILDDPFTSLANWQTTMGTTQYPLWNDNGKLPSGDSSIGNDGNNDAEFATPAAVTFGSGGLKISCTPSTQFSFYSWQCGLLNSLGKWTTPAAGFYIQVKAQPPDASNGQWTGVWAMPVNPPSFGTGELDIFEGGYSGQGTPNQTVATNLHTNGNSQAFYEDAANLSLAPHIYGVEFRSGVSVKWYVDGVLAATNTTNIPNTPYTVILDLQMAQNASGWHTNVYSGETGSFVMSIPEFQMYSLPN
jgi:hypothetical protein